MKSSSGNEPADVKRAEEWGWGVLRCLRWWPLVLLTHTMTTLGTRLWLLSPSHIPRGYTFPHIALQKFVTSPVFWLYHLPILHLSFSFPKMYLNLTICLLLNYRASLCFLDNIAHDKPDKNNHDHCWCVQSDHHALSILGCVGVMLWMTTRD